MFWKKAVTKNNVTEYKKRYRKITIGLIFAYIALMITFGVLTSQFSGKYHRSTLYNLGSKHEYTRVHNPNAFNENCYIDEAYGSSYYESEFVTEAFKFYEETGLQLYRIEIDIEHVDSVMSQSVAKEYALNRVKELVKNDEYAVVWYGTNYKYIYDDSGIESYEHKIDSFGVYDMVYFAGGTSTIFDSNGRKVLDLAKDAYYRYDLYDQYRSMEVGVFDVTLYGLGFDSYGSFGNHSSGFYYVIWTICRIMLWGLTIGIVVGLVLIHRHKWHMIETMEILSVELKQSDDGLADKYAETEQPVMKRPRKKQSTDSSSNKSSE